MVGTAVKVSVIIPTYNCPALTTAVESVLSQTFKNFEILIVDDGSTDKTRERVAAYLKKDPGRIKYFLQPNQGPGAARNRGLQEASGEYIAFLDDDDVWLPRKLEKQERFLNQHPQIGFVYCDNFFVNEQGKPLTDYVRKVRVYRGDVLLNLFLDHFLMTPSVMFRRSLLKAVGLFREDLRVGEDYEFFLRLAKHAQADFIDDKLWNRVVRQNSLSRQDIVLDGKNDLETLENFLAGHPEFHRRHKKTAEARLADYHYTFGYQALERGHNGLALSHFVKSIKYKPSGIALKNLCLCVIPFSIRKRLKKEYAQS